MKFLFYFALLLMCASLHAVEVDLSREYRCLCAVETGNTWQIGKAGETGPAQMAPVARMEDRDELSRLGRLVKMLRTHGFPVTPYTLAAMWHCPGRELARTLTAADVIYCRAVEKLYYDATFSR